MMRILQVTATLAFFLLNAQMAGAEDVSLSVYSSQEEYQAGDTLELSLSLVNSGESFDADLLVAIDCWGTLLYLPGLGTEAVPFMSARLPAGFSILDFPFFSIQMDEGIPDSEYAVIATIESSEDHSLRSNEARDDFRFDGGNGTDIVGRNAYLPLATGYSWTYYTENASESGEGSAVVHEAFENDGLREFHLLQDDDEDVELILIDDGGDIYVRDLLMKGASSFDQDQLILPAEPRAGDSWMLLMEYEGWPLPVTMRVEGRESVSVGAGDFDDCWHISMTAMFNAAQGDLWFARDVGLVAGNLDALSLISGRVELLDYDLTAD
ncbi:hypothetical protein J7M28_03470 [bacterium]|nr:hypothetical protein [bacterium]